MPDFVSQKEIAIRAGVSEATVSYALRDHPKISPPLRRKIQRLAAKLGYHADPVVSKAMTYLRTPRSRRPETRIAFLIPGYSLAFAATDRRLQLMISGARTYAETHGFLLDVFSLQESPPITPARMRTILNARGIEGVVVASMARGNDALSFDFSGFSAAAIGYSMRSPNIHRACPHHFLMMKGLVEDILAAGFRRIGLLLTKRLEEGSNNLLSAAFLHVQNQLPPEDRIPYRVEDRYTAAMVATWLREQRPEIVIGAGPVYSLLRDLGYDIPRDVSFASIDLGDPPYDAAGLIGRYDFVGMTAVDLVVGQMNLNHRGIPAQPKVVMVDSTWQLGPTVARRRPRTRAARR